MGLLGSISSGVGGLANAVTSIINTNKTNKANKQLAEYQYSKDLEMWNRLNAYNDPKAQMLRYQEAGLNPMLIYGTGTASAGNATTLPKYSAPTQNYSYEAPNVMSSLGQYTDMKAKNASIQSINEDITTKRLNNQILTATLLDAISGKKFGYKNQENQYHIGASQSFIKSKEAEYADLSEQGKAMQQFEKGNFMRRLLEQQLKNSMMANTLQGKTLEKYSADIAGTNLSNEFKTTQNKWYQKGGIKGLNDVLPFLKFAFGR